MDFISNQERQIEEMLSELGIGSVDELFRAIPESIRLKAPTEDDGLSEFEGMQLMREIAAKNGFADRKNYLGAGAYEHHVPAIVSSICGKSEFLTAYTPYQAEISQGLLQAIFEFQSALSALTGMDAANASVYDGASACAEALLMALRQKKKGRKVLVAESVHPHYRKVIDQYVARNAEIVTVPFKEDFQVDRSVIERNIDESTAAVLMQSPNFFGVLEEPIETNDVPLILAANPLAYGIVPSAKEFGASIAVGDTQAFGLPLQFGGPYVGYIACKTPFIRQLPGRIVGETTDQEGKRGFVLTLQAREQHIRREKATSNICSNQALAALASLVTLLWYGKEGVKKLALTNFQRAHYLRDRLAALDGVEILTNKEVFNEFAVRIEAPLENILPRMREKGIEPGLPLERFFPQFENALLVAVTETKSKNDLDRYAECLKEVL